MSSQKTLLLVDGHALIHRGFHALPHLTSPDGQPTGAVFGFARLLLAALKTTKPAFVAVAFDSAGPTFRHHQFAAYKAQRKEGPAELYLQIPTVRELVKSLNIPQFVLPGFEADDIIATLADQARKKGLKTVVLTGDMDLIQLVNQDTSLLAPRKGVSDPTIYTPATVEKRYTFGPAKMVFFKALRGDPSDNIPGVKGIGAVTATKLVRAFDSLDDMYRYLRREKKIPGIPAAAHTKLREQEAAARMSAELATVKADLPLTLKKKDCATHDFDRDRVVDFMTRYGFRSLLQELPGPQAPLFASARQTASATTPPPALTNKLDRQLAPVLRAMERRGILLNTTTLARLNDRLRHEKERLAKQIFAAAGLKFNIDSSRQLADILFNTLKLPAYGIKRLQSGYSTDAAQLERLQDEHKIVPLVMDYREVAKLLSTYTEPLPKLIGADGRLHTSYAPDTATGRISSKNPNLQNIPVRTERGREIRKAFVAAPGHVLVAADYSQIELRVVAHLSKDIALIKAFRDGQDIHAATSREMGVDRRVAKVINFSILYGKGPHGFARDLKIDIKEAKEYIDRYFMTYRGVNRWIEETLRFVTKNGYVETLFGFRRSFPWLRGRPVSRYSRLGREAINLPVQGTAAEILKMAMQSIANEPKLADTMVLTVHDELVFELPQKSALVLSKKIKGIMEAAATLDVPLTVDIALGPNWGELK